MTVPISDRLSQLYVGNDINQRFDFTFRVFNQESESGIVVRQKTAVEFVTLDPSLYTVTLNQDNLGGHIDFISPPESNVYFYIAGATALDQLLDITNYDNFYPDAIERALDKLTALLQEWGTQLDQEKQARILADIHYDSLAMEREENLENRLISYINAVMGITNPKIFDGISDRMIITKDGRTQREFNESIPFWTEDYVGFKQETYLREEQIIEHAKNLNIQTTQLIDNEKLRALAAENGLQSQINAVGVGNKAYLTYATMDADKLNIAINSKVTVTNDATSSNNGDWQWDGVTFTKSIYDPITQAVGQSKTYTDAQIKELNFVRGVNIFDKSKVEYSKYYSYLDGQKGYATADFVAAGLYIIEGGVEYRVPANYTQQFACFDANKVYISGQENAGPTHKFTTPANAKYIGLTVEVEILDTFMLCKSSEYPALYTPYIEGKNDFLINTEQVNDLFKNIKQELGFTYINIVDPTNVIANHYVDYLSGQVGSVNGFYAAGPYEIKPNTEYQTSSAYNQQGGFYDKHGDFISGFAPLTAPHKFTTPANAKYLKLTIPNAQLNTLVVAESTLFPSNYVPHTAKIIDELIVDDVKTNEIWVSADINDNSVEFKGKNAIQLALDSITDANAKNRYVIRVKKGLYKITQANQFIGYPGYPAMILMKEHVDIVGQGKDNTIIWAELPYDDAAIGASANGNVLPRSSYQTVYDYADDAIMKDLTLVAKNLRYTVHIDNPNGIDKTHKYKDVDFIFKGDKGNLISLGIGTHSGEETYIEGGTSHSDTHIPFACHNNIAFGKPSLWSFKGHTFSSINSKYAIYMQSDGSLLQDKLNLEGCSFAGSAYLLEYVQVWLTGDTSLNRDTFNHAEWLNTGYGNEPFLFSNLVEGYCLRIKSNTTGVSTSIRFDKNSSAYPILIKNNQSNTDTSLYINSREFIDGYIVQDGSVGLAAQAWGCKDLAESIYLYDNGVNFTSMGKRLGDCSTVSKVLVVIVNGVTNSITFNKDYTEMSNVQILSEINAQLSGATADLYIYGRDYFPILSDVSEVVYNTGVSYIPKGSVVTKSKGTVKLANGNDKVYGVALDDIPVMITTSEGVKKGEGRVLKRGYIYANQGRTHFVLSDNQNPQLGARFSVNNGQLVTDVNGKISCDIDIGVISINC